MNSQLIYIVANRMRGRVDWNEWIYCGIEDDLREDVISRFIDEYLPENTFYAVTTKRESVEIGKQDLMQKIKAALGKNEILIWDTNFKKVIEFYRIAVMRRGLARTEVHLS